MENVASLVVYGDDAVSGEISSPGTMDGFGSIVALDAQENPVSGVDVVPVQAEVRIPVTKESADKELIVNASVAGMPRYPAEVVGVETQPDRVKVMGVPDLLAATSTVDTEPVDISGATSDVTRTVGLNLPTGLSTMSPIIVTVTVHVRTVGAALPTHR
jgi:YbbR domain-containing protein